MVNMRHFKIGHSVNQTTNMLSITLLFNTLLYFIVLGGLVVLVLVLVLVLLSVSVLVWWLDAVRSFLSN